MASAMSFFNDPTTSTDDRLPRHIRQRLRLLKWELKTIESESDGKSLSKEELRRKTTVCALIQEFSNLLGLSYADPNAIIADHSVCQPVVNPQLEKGRYLCVSYGFTMHCLDLKKKRIDEYVPRISTLHLLQEGLPVSMGMFKLNSVAYLVGGQEFPGFKIIPPSLWDLELFDLLYHKYGVKGSSRDTYHLSLADDECLSLRDCNFIGPLNKPKIWPIVEQIGDEIHVMESLPRILVNHIPNKIPTHEVLNLKDLGHGWTELSPAFSPGKGKMFMYMWNHIVVGDRIYASPFDSSRFAVFDSKTRKWELQDSVNEEREGNPRSRGRGSFKRNPIRKWTTDPYADSRRPSSIKHVSQILRFGSGRCVARSLLGDDGLCVIIALGFETYMERMAEAYLVTPRGQILCFQKLPHFCEKFNRSFIGREGRVINVDEQGETMCAIFHGVTYGDTCEKFLFISTFTVEEVEDANLVVQDLMPRRLNDDDDVGKLPSAVEKVFVKVVVKDVYAYKKEDEVGPEEVETVYSLSGVSACFL